VLGLHHVVTKEIRMNDTLIHDQSNAPAVPPPPVDFGVAADDYGRHRQGHPDATFDRLAAQFLVGLPGQDIVDIGTGTGAAARALAARGARVIGLDPSPALLAEAARLAAAANLTVDWRHACAEDTRLPDACADAVTVAQAWHWFDRPRAAAEVRRLLRPGGAVAIIHTDWLPQPGNVVERTLAIAADQGCTYNPPDHGLFHHGIYPYWPDDLAAAGFTGIEMFGFDLTQRYTHAGWCGRMRASAMISTMPPAGRAGFERELLAWLAAHHPDPMDVPHRAFVVVARRPR
jgi:SAM-dependent methyltransferase